MTRHRILAGTLALLGLLAQPGEAQSSRSAFATREALEVRASDAERLAADVGANSGIREEKRGEAFTLRYRLQHGDFRPGDRIVLTTRIEQQAVDTLIVGDDQSLNIKGFPKVSLEGVLRSELEGRLRSHLATYVRDPRLTAIPLVRLSVTGSVARPGFYNVPADALMSDVIMIAGGPTGDADISRTVVRRDNEEVWPSETVSTAINDGYSLDAFDLRAGDELMIGARRSTNWEAVFRTAGMAAGLVSLFLTVR